MTLRYGSLRKFFQSSVIAYSGLCVLFCEDSENNTKIEVGVSAGRLTFDVLLFYSKFGERAPLAATSDKMIGKYRSFQAAFL